MPNLAGQLLATRPTEVPGAVPTIDMTALVGEAIMLTCSATGAAGTNTVFIECPEDEVWELVRSSMQNDTTASTGDHYIHFFGKTSAPAAVVPTGWTPGSYAIQLARGTTPGAGVATSYEPNAPLPMGPGDRIRFLFAGTTLSDTISFTALIRRRKLRA